MSDTKCTDDKVISMNSQKTLTIKRSRVEQAPVRQSFSHGRTKSVTVEKKRKFIKTPQELQELSSFKPSPSEKNGSQNKEVILGEMPLGIKQEEHIVEENIFSPSVTGNLSSSELDARRRALEGSLQREMQEKKEAIELYKKRQEESKNKVEDVVDPIELQETNLIKKEAELRHKVEEENRRRLPKKDLSSSDLDDEVLSKKKIGFGAEKTSKLAPDLLKSKGYTRVKEEYGRQKMTLNSVFRGEESNVRSPSLSAMRRRHEKFKRSLNQLPREKIIREVLLPETITIQELASRMSERAVEVVKFFMKQGQMMKPGDVLDADTAELVASEFGHTVKRVLESDIEGGLFHVQDDPKDMKPRPPVVSVMGHVDHGKTSLLDAIRKANIAQKETGGITQHIGAYQAERLGQKITFIDTPGHAAFSAMRERGVKATDIVILVVAADDGIMPQTIESIHHAKAANVAMIVAINKIDKPDSNPDKVRRDLLQHSVFVESMGGDILDVEISAKTGLNLDKLLDTIFLQAELLDLKANPDRTAEGVVIEAKLDPTRGPIASVIVQTGTLMPGDIIVAGNEWGRVRAIISDQGINVQEALPSMPVAMLGLQSAPKAGDHFSTVENEARARQITEYRQRLAHDKAVAKHIKQRGSIHNMITQLQDINLKELPILIKSDVHGSLGAIISALEDLGTEEVCVRIIHSSAGAITESDVSLAETSGASILGFNVRPTPQARVMAQKAKVMIHQYNIIYTLIEDMKSKMSELLSPERNEIFLGKAKVLEVFNISKIGNIAGSRLVEGKIERGAHARLIRDEVILHEGFVGTLRRFKEEVHEVNQGECGIGFKNYFDIRPGDIIEVYRVEMKKRTL